MRFRQPRLLRRIVAFFTWSARDREMDREMAFHIESITRDLIASGMDAADADREARQRFGRVRQLKEEGHDIRSAQVLDDLSRDVRHMARGLRKSPVFTITVVLTLGLAIGGNTAIFSIVDQLLLRPLPYPGGDRLVSVDRPFRACPPRPGDSATACRQPTGSTGNATAARFRAWRPGGHLR